MSIKLLVQLKDTAELMDYILAFGVCQCKGVKFNAMPGVNFSFGTEVHIHQVENQSYATSNCIGLFIGDLRFGKHLKCVHISAIFFHCTEFDGK